MTGFLKLVFRNRLAALGAVVLAAILILALVTPLLPLADPDIPATADRFKPPFSEGHLLGTDHLGRDLLARLLQGRMMALTRLPSARRASTQGWLSSIRRPIAETILSMIRKRCCSSRNCTEVFSSTPNRST